MKAFYTDHFVLPLPEGHRFPMAKYARLRQEVLARGLIAPQDLQVPDAATEGELARAHDAEYLARAMSGTLAREEVRRIGFPWSLGMIERSRRSAGATLAAARIALTEGVAVNLAGGTHHAFADRGEGFCVFNDVAVAARTLLAQGLIQRAVVIDTDVHQGNGTAAIFRDEPAVFTFSIHNGNNFPFHKEVSDLDIALGDGTGDRDFLAHLDRGLDQALEASQADLAFFVSGADPHERDRLGRFALTFEGLAERDRLVFARCRALGLPVVVTMAGGYGRDLEETVAIHLRTIQEARENHQSPTVESNRDSEVAAL